MPCYHPQTAYYASEVNKSGKRGVVFSKPASFSGVPLRLPCGSCIGCRLERSRQWAMRCMHERRLHDSNWFLTLTYEDKWLPYGGTLVKRDFQLFMKRLRRRYGDGIRFFGCGEYGSRSLRPHYHAILFNLTLEDVRRYKEVASGVLYSSKGLELVWPYGFNVLGEVTFESCAYVARYVVDKITGKAAEAAYDKVMPDGEVVKMEPEFVLMSRRPGLGTGWFEKYGAETYAHDSVVINGREVRPPRFYDGKIDPARLAVLKAKRLERAREFKADNTPERRRVKGEVVRRNLNRFAREVEE